MFKRMTVDLKNLSAMAYGKGTTWWDYRTDDSQRDMERATYWKDAQGILKAGDFVMISNDWCGTLYWVSEVGPNGVYLKRMCDSKTVAE